VILAGSWQQRRAASSDVGGAAVAPGCARVRLWAGPSGLAAMLSGRAEGQSGQRARRCLPPEKAVFLVQDWESNAFGLLLILDDNYNLTTNKFTTKRQSAQRTHRDLLSRAICCGLQIAILAGRWQQHRAAHRLWLRPGLWALRS